MAKKPATPVATEDDTVLPTTKPGRPSKAGDSHLTQGVNTDDLPLKNGVPVQPDEAE